MPNKYQQVAAALREQLRHLANTGTERLPSYRELCAIHQVSEITVRRAVGVLVRENLVRCERGRNKGIRVCTPAEARAAAGERERDRTVQRICLASRWPFLDSDQSDFPALYYGVSQEMDFRVCSLDIIPRQEGLDMLNLFRSWYPRERPDGLILIPDDRIDAAEVVACARVGKVKSILLSSVQNAESENFKRLGFPGVYTEEIAALRELLTLAARRGRRRIRLLALDELSNTRLRDLLRIAYGAQPWELHRDRPPTGPEADQYQFIATQLELVRRDPETLLLVEGCAHTVDLLYAILRERNIQPGRDVAIALYQHYCSLRPAHTRSLTAITRPFEAIGRAAARLMLTILDRRPTEKIVTLSSRLNAVDTV